jgi:uncharacterized iron-regulated protein
VPKAFIKEAKAIIKLTKAFNAAVIVPKVQRSTTKKAVIKKVAQLAQAFYKGTQNHLRATAKEKKAQEANNFATPLTNCLLTFSAKKSYLNDSDPVAQKSNINAIYAKLNRLINAIAKGNCISLVAAT